MIRFIILFITRVKRFSCCFLRIVRVYPIDTTNSPLHERETAYTLGRATVLPGRSYRRHERAAIQPGIHLGRTAVSPGRSYHRYECAAMQPGIHPKHAAAPLGRSLFAPRCSAKINPARLLRAGYPAMK